MRRILVASLLLVWSGVPSMAAETELQQARALLSRPTPTGVIAGLKLDGFRFSRELEVGGGVRVMAIAGQFGGGLAAYGASGDLIASIATHEITWLQLFDLDEDGQSEVITEEVDGRGTDVLMKSFAVYGIRSKKIEKLWSGESYFRSVPYDRPNASEERLGFIRFFPSGGGYANARLIHVQRIEGHWRENVYEMRDGHLSRASASRRSSAGRPASIPRRN